VYRLVVMRGRALVWWFGPGALAVLVMLPRLLSSQFGLLDDGLTLQTGRETLGRWSSVLGLIPETGRFFPAYWLVYSAVFGIVGARPLAFFILNVALLAGLLVLLARVVRLTRGTPVQAVVAVVAFAVCGPAIEAFYTLSKAEPLQMVWIGLSVLAAAASAREPHRGPRAGLITLAGAALVLAYATKETSVVLIPVSLGWVAVEWSLRGERQTGARFAITFAALNVAGAAVFFALRWRYAALPLAEGMYTRAYSLEPGTIGPALFRLCAWMVRDFAFLLPLTAAALVVLPWGGPEWRRRILYAFVWMGGWLAVYAPWPATFEYYLLPFAAGAAIFAGTVVGRLWQVRGQRYPAPARRMAQAALAASALLWLPTVVNAAADGRVQLAVDRANADLVEFLAGLPSGSRVVLNTTVANEYLYELPLHLAELKRRPDLVVQHVGASAPGARSPAEVFVVTPTMANQPGPTVRIALHEAGVIRDNTRLREMLGEWDERVYASERHVRLVELGTHRLLCRLAVRPFVDATYCPGDRGLVYARTFTYGWQVHRLARSAVDRVETPA
jgi:hypothetical protein